MSENTPSSLMCCVSHDPRVLEIASSSAFILWPRGRIPYQIPNPGEFPAFSPATVTTIQNAIANWNNVLGGVVRIVPKTPADQSFLDIWRATPGSANWAEIGFRQGQNTMWLQDGVGIGVIQHELGHVIGLHHEHMRPDRDQFLTVLESQIPRDSYPDTWGQVVAQVDRAVGPYDYGSVMHYGSEWDRPNLRVTSTVRNNSGNMVPAIGGSIVGTSRTGLATRIDWDNGVVLSRSDAEPSAPPVRVLFELSGTWQSNVGVEYFFNQLGRSFSWRCPGLGQVGEGTIQGSSATPGD